ncbi:hypothetical protein B0H13DRAFT_1868238 [Mycena leptocephala]|nr:hypothetical protein B0H13DRAFT_1868238 [Mycena leptocephala]
MGERRAKGQEEELPARLKEKDEDAAPIRVFVFTKRVPGRKGVARKTPRVRPVMRYTVRDLKQTWKIRPGRIDADGEHRHAVGRRAGQGAGGAHRGLVENWNTKAAVSRRDSPKKRDTEHDAKHPCKTERCRPPRQSTARISANARLPAPQGREQEKLQEPYRDAMAHAPTADGEQRHMHAARRGCGAEVTQSRSQRHPVAEYGTPTSGRAEVMRVERGHRGAKNAT